MGRRDRYLGSIGWNEGAGRYVDLASGRFISRQEAFEAVDRSIIALTEEAGDFLSGALTEGLPLEIFQRALMREVKLGYMMTYVTGRGGWEQMTARDWGLVGQQIKEKYAYIEGFMGRISSGEVSEEQVRQNMDMYFHNMVVGYWRGDREAQISSGKRYMIRHLNSRVPCKDCPGYAEHWEKIGDLPLPSEQCECRSACLCTVEYSETLLQERML